MNRRNFDLEKVVRISRASTEHLALDISTNNPPVRINPEEAIKIMDGPDDPICYFCHGVGFNIDPTPTSLGGFVQTSTCQTCEGTGKIKLKK